MECKLVVDQKVAFGGARMKIEGALEIFRADMRPVPNAIYTIAAIVPDQNFVFLTLKEFPEWCGYDHRLFRPLQDRPKEADTDISVFLPALNTKTLEPVE